jgi:transcription initiation factor TFIID subunit 2
MDASSTAQSSALDVKPPVAVNRFTLVSQKVELDINFNQQITGRVEIEIHPESNTFQDIYLNARQCKIRNVVVNGVKTLNYYHVDPCKETVLNFNANAHQHHILAAKIDSVRQSQPRPFPNLVISVPPAVKIEEVNEIDVHTTTGNTIRISNDAQNGINPADASGLAGSASAKYTPLTVSMDFESKHMGDLVHFVTSDRGTGRWPHAYTRGKPGGEVAGALFPCVDSLYARGFWEISITIPKTVGDALAQFLPDLSSLSLQDKPKNISRPAHENKEMVVVCSGDFEHEVVSKTDPTKKIVTFNCLERLSARQIGFAIGPFERVDLNELRSPEDKDKLGDNAVQMFGYCLPRRSEEVKNTCLPTTRAMDQMVQLYSSAPFNTHSICFVEDPADDVTVFAGLSMCSTRLLYPEQVIDNCQDVARKLVHSLAAQWLGIWIIPETAQDMWVVVGIAHFMTDLFMKELCGTNEYRARMRMLSDDIVAQDKDRPSIYEMGEILHIDSHAYDFIALKAPVVLFILDRRMAKTAGAAKMPGIISKILTRARTSELENNALSTDFFQKTAERANHGPINDFMQQWVKGAGCPHFKITQRFNKKKLTIEMLFEQVQTTADKELDASNFVRDAREDWNEVYAAEKQNFFTGPMTIRVHEADGSPYEHIVQIRDGHTQIDVPYKTKYKRLKRTRKQRNKVTAKAVEEEDEEEEKRLVYYLGDVLQEEEDLKNWDLVDWSQEMENMMQMESFEWIRADADFEWIAHIELGLQGYMYASQLQQDRDIVSQLQAINSITSYKADKTVSSILLRTVMDRRYFHRIRYLAAQGLVKHAHQINDETGIEVTVGKIHLQKAFDELFCNFDSGMPIIRPNDFSDPQQYMAQVAIVEAVSKIRDKNGNAPHDVKLWMLDKLKFNDNSSNEYSDAFYVSTLMRGLVKTLVAKPSSSPDMDDMDLDQVRAAAELNQFEASCVEEIDRFRRMDEWTSSYQNLYSRTALECQAQLAHAGIIRFSPCHFLQYTRPGNYELLRLAAYKILIERDMFNTHSLVKYVVTCLAVDSSPMIRRELQTAFGRILGQQAIGDGAKHAITIDESTTATNGDADLLVVDTAASDAAVVSRAEEIARRSSLEAALKGLKKDLRDHETLKQSLWDAAEYEKITFDDLGTILDFCRMLYEPKDQIVVTLALPRYWKVQNLGHGKLKFSQTSKVRTKIMKARFQLADPAAQSAPPPSLQDKVYNTMPPPGPIKLPNHAPAQQPQRQGSLKLKFGRTHSMSASTNAATDDGYFGTGQIVVKSEVQTPTAMPTPPPQPSTPMNVKPPPTNHKKRSESPMQLSELPQPPQKKITLKLGGVRQGSISSSGGGGTPS